jgi:toxin ParE1/3/4
MPTGYRVELTAAAERDLEEIVRYIAEHDLPERALQMLDAIESVIDGLATEPRRGSHPKELAALGMHEFREVHYKPYRIIYRVFETEQAVRVYLIADGRRSLQRVLERRLLGA